MKIPRNYMIKNQKSSGANEVLMHTQVVEDHTYDDIHVNINQAKTKKEGQKFPKTKIHANPKAKLKEDMITNSQGSDMHPITYCLSSNHDPALNVL